VDPRSSILGGFSRQQVKDRWVERRKKEDDELNHLRQRRISYIRHPSMAALMGMLDLACFSAFLPIPLPFILTGQGGGKAGSHRGSNSPSRSRGPTIGVRSTKI